MMYGYMTLSDDTGIAHSEMKADGTVKVYFERPVEGGFLSATCYLPDYRWENIEGYTQEEIDKLQELIQSLAATIYELAREGGFEHASAV